MLDMFNIMSQFRWYWNLAMILRRRLCLSSRVNSKGRGETTLFLFEKIMHQSIPPSPSPYLRATAGHLPALSVPGVGHLQWKMLQCWRRMGHLPSFSVPTPGDLTAQESPLPGIYHPRQKKCLCPWVSPGRAGWAQVELTDALREVSSVM